MDMYGEPSIVQMAKIQRVRWLTHVYRMPNEMNTEKILLGGDEQKKKRGPPTSKKEVVASSEREHKGTCIQDWEGRKCIREK